ncbi:MAG: NTP transferase domain-containing protein [Planctomycetota bacterium]
MSSSRTFAGVLAAGHGARFQAAGVRTPKALVEVGGRSLVQRTLDAFADAALEPVTLVVNDAVAPEVARHLSLRVEAPKHVVHVKTTASTLETFVTLLGLATDAGAERFVFTTVDAVSASGELARFDREARGAGEPLVLGVATVEPDDESPLLVTTDAAGLAFLGRGPYATAGFYAGDVRRIARDARAALAEGQPSLRVFLTRQAAVSPVRAVILGRTLDVDTPGDVAVAERALSSWERT